MDAVDVAYVLYLFWEEVSKVGRGDLQIAPITSRNVRKILSRSRKTVQ